MCGRYLFDDGKHPEIQQIIQRLKHEFSEEFLSDIALKEIFPASKTIVLIDDLQPTIMEWGYPHWKYKRRIINARFETYRSSFFFQDSKPCVIAASGYFEWNKMNIKNYLHSSESLYMAGLYNSNNQFVILTKPAEPPYLDIHPRMPVLLSKENALKYLKHKKKS